MKFQNVDFWNDGSGPKYAFASCEYYLGLFFGGSGCATRKIARKWELINLERNMWNSEEEKENREKKKSAAEFEEENVLSQHSEDNGKSTKNWEIRIKKNEEWSIEKWI